MQDVQIGKNDEIVMKLLHYFITEKGYNPVILHGAKDEIWLENMDSSYEIVRIVSGYIHNNEQLDFDLYKTKQIVKKIKKTTCSFQVNTLSLFVNLGDNVDLTNRNPVNHIDCAQVNSINDLTKYDFIMKEFPNITVETNFKEKGMNLFLKITEEISKKNEETSEKAESVFKKKKPVVTMALIMINVLVFISMYLFGNGSDDALTLIYFGANVKELVQAGEFYRLITSSFLHIGILHLLCNMYCLYVIGSQIESFFGKWKFLIIYLFSAICGNLLSIATGTSISAGASGAIFGLFGSLLYFGYHYRVYLGSVIRSQIIPLIVLNLLIGFVFTNVDNAAHIGGLVGGALITSFLGVKYKSTTSEKINGGIITTIFTIFLIYIAFFMN
jgi:rhomboid protease GluP